MAFVLITGNVLKNSPARQTPNQVLLEEMWKAMDDTLRACQPLGIESEDGFVVRDPLSSDVDAGDTDTQITIKMLIPLECTEPDESMIEKAIACLRTRLGVQHIHQWILGWAAVQSSMPEALSRLAPLWQRLEVAVQEGFIGRIGVSDFTSIQLEKWMAMVKTPPQVNQVHLTFKDCCTSPHHEVLAFCKSNNITVLSHGDPPEFMEPKMFRALLRKYGVLGSSSNVSQSEGQPRFQVAPVLDWVLRFTQVIESRGVAENKGYIVHASLPTDSTLLPNHSSPE